MGGQCSGSRSTWTEAEDEIIRDGYAVGESLANIALVISRVRHTNVSSNAISGRAARLGLTHPGANPLVWATRKERYGTCGMKPFNG